MLLRPESDYLKRTYTFLTRQLHTRTSGIRKTSDRNLGRFRYGAPLRLSRMRSSVLPHRLSLQTRREF